MRNTKCPDCGVEPGSPHETGCDVAHCTVCRGQRLQCDCDGHDPAGDPWTGEWPGKADCRKFGWYVLFVPGKGWVPCDKEIPGATEDLNRWSFWIQTGQDALRNRT